MKNKIRVGLSVLTAGFIFLSSTNGAAQDSSAVSPPVADTLKAADPEVLGPPEIPKEEAQKRRRKEKEDARQWKQIARKYVKNPIALKKREEERQFLIDSLTVVAQRLYNKLQEISKGYVSLEGDVRSAIKNGMLELEVRDHYIDSVKNRNASLEGAYVALQEAYEVCQKKSPPVESAAKSSGKTPDVYFRVQIGAYNVAKHTLQLLESDVIRETGPNNVNRYVLGRFTDVNKAIAYRDELRRLGIKDAFVTAYHNGKRVTIAEATALLQKRPTGAAKSAPPPTKTTGNATTAPIEPQTRPTPPYDKKPAGADPRKAETEALRRSDADPVIDKGPPKKPVDE